MKAASQLGEEMKRTAQESDMSADRLAAGQAADGLVDNRLENGGGQVFLGRALVDQRLDIRSWRIRRSGPRWGKAPCNFWHIHSVRRHLSEEEKPSGR